MLAGCTTPDYAVVGRVPSRGETLQHHRGTLANGSGPKKLPRESSAQEQAYRWLCAQQGSHGILGNQDGGSFAGLYPNALAAMTFLERGDRVRCEKALDFFAAMSQHEFQWEPGGFHQFYDAVTGKTAMDSDRWMGDNCWLLIALNHYAARTGSSRYRLMAEDISAWLVRLQDEDGGIWAGYNLSGLMRAKSTEGNLDAYAALVSRPQARARVATWLWEKAWLREEGRFRMGSTNSGPALDTSAWGVLALGRRAWPAIGFADWHLRIKRTFHDQTIEGFADFIGKQRIWFEGTGQMACALWHGGDREQAEHFIAELEKAMVLSRGVPGTLGIPCHSNDPSWEGGATKGFVPSVCWYLFAKWRFNPMQGFKP